MFLFPLKRQMRNKTSKMFGVYTILYIFYILSIGFMETNSFITSETVQHKYGTCPEVKPMKEFNIFAVRKPENPINILRH